METLRGLALLLFAIGISNLPVTSAFDELPLGVPFASPFLFQLNNSDNAKLGQRASNDEQFLAQPIDHFDSKNATFEQRYFVNKNYAKNSTSVHILYLEGAYPADSNKASDINYPHVANAKELQATVWVLEHRFHGKSLPYKTSTIENMATLNIQQTIEDIKYFIMTQNKASKETNPKWIVYGAYYAGSLALWFRQKYPKLSVGVVTSSAPAAAAADFYRYQKNVEDTYAAYDSKCYENIKSSATKVRQMIQYSEGRSKLSTDLKLNPSFASLGLTQNDFQFFYVVLLSFLQMPVQFNKVNAGPFGNAGGIAEACKIFADSNIDEFGKITSLVSYIYSLFKVKFSDQTKLVPNSYIALVKKLQNTNTFDAQLQLGASPRTFLWQQCNELGYFTTTDFSGLMFGSAIPNNYWLNLCEDVFGSSYNVDNLKKGVKLSTKLYGSSPLYSGSNAIIVAGSQDPVRTLGYTGVSDSSSFFFNAYGAAFCADQQPAMENDLYSVIKVRTLITKRLKLWLSGKSDSKKTRKSIPLTIARKEAKVEDLKIVNWDTEIQWEATRPEIPQKFKLNNALRTSIRPRTDLKTIFRKRVGEEEFKKTTTKAYSGFIRTATIRQRVDNFDANNNASYSQFFFYNDKYEQANSNLIFLMLGGEGPIDQFFIGDTRISMVSWAAEFGASLYELEHRFYGRSIPTEDLSVNNLKFLTSQQALADAAVFINKINTDRKLTYPKWIVFGGSYPGSLTAWIRLKYPKLVYGSVASSAPVQAKTDYFEYMQTVQNSTKAFGSKSCQNDVHRFFAWFQKQLTTVTGRNGIANLFGLCDKWDADYINDKDSEFLIGSFVMTIAGYVQYDDERHQRLSQICQGFKQMDDQLGAWTDTTNVHSNSSALRTQLKQQVQKLMFGKARSEDADDCQPFTYKMIVDMMSEVSPYDTQERGWVWQTCNELGVAQSTNFGYSMFESALPVNHFIDLCTDVYGKDRNYVDAHVQYTNEYYGGQDNFNGTNVVFVNGSEDPWNPLSVYEPKDKSVSSIRIDGSSHCEDMFMLDDDTRAIKKAHKAIKNVLTKWVNA